MNEIWKPIKGFEGYEVSSKGRVRSYRKPRHRHAMYKKPFLKKRFINSAGYYGVSMMDEGGQHTKSVPRLVAEHFIPNPKNKPCVNHKDGNKLKDYVENLEWVTHSENTQHALENGLMDPPVGERCATSVLKERDVLQIRSIYEQFPFSQREIAKAYNVDQTTISYLVNKKTWRHI